MNDMIIEECSSSDRAICPAGIHNAVCVLVHNLGKQPSLNTEWPARQKMVLMFETGDLIDSGTLSGQPYRMSKIMTASLNERATLRQWLISWYGTDPIQSVNGKRRFDVAQLVGKPATITVVHDGFNGETRPKIVAIAPPMPGQPALMAKMNPSEIPDWIRTMEAQRLDKPKNECTVANQVQL